MYWTTQVCLRDFFNTKSYMQYRYINIKAFSAPIFWGYVQIYFSKLNCLVKIEGFVYTVIVFI